MKCLAIARKTYGYIFANYVWITPFLLLISTMSFIEIAFVSKYVAPLKQFGMFPPVFSTLMSVYFFIVVHCADENTTYSDIFSLLTDRTISIRAMKIILFLIMYSILLFVFTYTSSVWMHFINFHSKLYSLFVYFPLFIMAMYILFRIMLVPSCLAIGISRPFRYSWRITNRNFIMLYTTLIITLSPIWIVMILAVIFLFEDGADRIISDGGGMIIDSIFFAVLLASELCILSAMFRYCYKEFSLNEKSLMK